MKMRFPRPIALLPLVAALAACAPMSSQQPAAPAAPLSVKVLAINDFHGNLKPAASGIKVPDTSDPKKLVTVQAGGAEHMATLVKQIKAKNPNHVFVAAGDLIGASPLLSALFHDEPTVEALSLMGLDASAVGNHEFDAGVTELLRKQNGGCHPKDGCKGPQPFKGSGFQYLAASTVDLKTGKTVLPPYVIRNFEGVDVAFIGMTLKGTPELVIPTAAAGLRFDDEAETVNKLVPELRAKGIEAIAVLIHEGGTPSGGYNECPGISGPIVDIVKRFDKAVDFVVTGHTHRAYNCRIDGRLVTSGDKYGTIVTEIDLQIDRKTRDIISASADNRIVRTDAYAKDPAQTALIAGYEKQAAPLINRVVGRIAETYPREANAAGASAMGQLIADAQLAATATTAGAQIALMNLFGVREAFTYRNEGVLTFGDVYTVQPFNNQLVTLTLTGEQIRRAIEQQWRDESLRGPYLQVSKGFGYTWDAKRPAGARVLPETMTLNGKAMDMNARYRVTVNNFIAAGGDGFRALTEGTDARIGASDIDALVAYIEAEAKKAPLKPMALDRVKRIN